MDKHSPRGVVLGLAVLMPFLGGCATIYEIPCEFTVKVRVTDQADAECKARGAVDHWGIKVPDSYTHDAARNQVQLPPTVNGCAPKGLIISNGSESNLGHEAKHHVERNCKRVRKK